MPKRRFCRTERGNMPAKTIRTGILGKVDLRLAQQGQEFFGIADGKVVVQGDDSDDVWRRASLRRSV